MKKIILIALLIYCIPLKAQLFTESIDTNRESVASSLYGITDLSNIFSKYSCAILCDSVMKVSTNQDMTEFTLTKAGLWTYLGIFNAKSIITLWCRKANIETTAVNTSWVFWEVK